MITIKTLFEKTIDLSKFEPYQIACDKCCGLCCVALFFSKTDRFPENKIAGKACKNLQPDYKCSIHSKLFSQGLKGCLAYDCFGAGWQVTHHLSSTPDWQSISPREAETICKSYLNVMQLHQVLWYLTQASILYLPTEEKAQINQMIEKGKALARQPLSILQDINVESFRQQSNKILKQISASISSVLQPASGTEKQIKNYMGTNMKRTNLTGKDFSMSLLIAANLEQSNLYGTNFLGADMRDTNIQNTDLSHSLFLTQIQVNAAKGNRNTVLPPYLCAPQAWK